MENPYCLKTIFTFEEAASAMAGIIRRTHENQQERQLILNELIEAAKRKKFRFESVTVYSYQQVEPFFEPSRTVRRPAGTDWNRCRITRDDLIAWCQSRQLYPALLFPQQAESIQQKQVDSPVSQYHTPALDALHAAIAQFWVNHDPKHPPKKEEIIDWLQRTHGLTKSMAEAIDKIIRPVERRTGGQIARAKSTRKGFLG